MLTLGEFINAIHGIGVRMACSINMHFVVKFVRARQPTDDRCKRNPTKRNGNLPDTIKTTAVTMNESQCLMRQMQRFAQQTMYSTFLMCQKRVCIYSVQRCANKILIVIPNI